MLRNPCHRPIPLASRTSKFFYVPETENLEGKVRLNDG